MAPNTSKSDECNNNHALHKTAAAGLSLSKAAACAPAAAAAVLQVHKSSKRPQLPPALPAPSPSAPYFCCKGRQFHLYSGLMRHIKAEHRLKPLFYCEPCRLCVTTERAINKHREVVHEGRTVRFLCGVCMAADYNRFAIQKHLDKNHADVEDRARYLVDLVHEWPEYYELRAAREI